MIYAICTVLISAVVAFLTARVTAKLCLTKIDHYVEMVMERAKEIMEIVFSSQNRN